MRSMVEGAQSEMPGPLRQRSALPPHRPREDQRKLAVSTWPALGSCTITA